MATLHVRSSDTPDIDAMWGVISDDEAIRVGRFFAASSLLELKLELLIWRLIRADQPDLRPLTSRLEVTKKIEAINVLIERHPELVAGRTSEWDKAKPLITSLAPKRAWLAHGVWIPWPRGVLRIRAGDSSDFIGKLKPLTTEELDEWIADAAQAIRHVNQILEPSEPTPSPDTP
jgi:hypothetical protein